MMYSLTLYVFLLINGQPVSSPSAVVIYGMTSEAHCAKVTAQHEKELRKTGIKVLVKGVCTVDEGGG